MSFNPEKIKSQDILDAVEEIEDKNINLIPSTGYDVLIAGKRYPPKEIIRYAFRIATGWRFRRS